ncbi:MAG: hypothetical protein KA767_03385 [Saprospiraceae bacterium]|nr:hypothetical protein [Saprospiraceae bacterium]
MKYWNIFILPIFLLCELRSQSPNFDVKTIVIPLQNVAGFYEDQRNNITIDSIINKGNIQFEKIDNLNLGIINHATWLKFNISNSGSMEKRYLLVFNSPINDTLSIYRVGKDNNIQKLLLGESIPARHQTFKHETPVIEIILKPYESALYYIKSSSYIKLINLSATIFDPDSFYHWLSKKRFFQGLVYGVIGLIIFLNMSFYFITNERIYVIFSLQLVFIILCLAYFDGFIYQFLFPNSGYWANQSIAIAMCATFICSNKFIPEIFNLHVVSPKLEKAFRLLNYAIFFILAFSFYHNFGFNFFIIGMSCITFVVALLLLFSIVAAKNSGQSSYVFISFSSASLIFFGTIFQFYLFGLLGYNFITHYAMHMGSLFQAIFLALAVNDKFKLIRQQNEVYQQKLVDALNHQSQNLIVTIEAERNRIATDIHDGVGQNLLSMRNKILRTLKQKEIPLSIQESLHALLDITTETLDDARAMSYDLRPPILSTMGLTVAIKSMITKLKEISIFEIKSTFDVSLDDLLIKELEINLFRIIQECFSNVLKHAQASVVDIKFSLKDQILELNFNDNGLGFDVESNNIGQGILGMRERVALLKGTLQIISKPNNGTNITIKIPTQINNK